MRSAFLPRRHIMRTRFDTNEEYGPSPPTPLTWIGSPIWRNRERRES